MSSKLIIAGTLAAVVLAACSSSPTAPSQPSAAKGPAVTNTTPGDSVQATAERGNVFGSGT